jgi:hypothetical protein
MPLAVTFGQSLILLGVTAVLTGVLAPIIVGMTNSSRLNEQKKYEEGLKRETAFFEAQAEFLKDYSGAVWAYLEKGLQVSYAGKHELQGFKDVYDEYDKASWPLFGRIAYDVSMSTTLFSRKTADELDQFYKWLQYSFDTDLSRQALSQETTQAQWASWHDRMHGEAQERATVLIGAVAEEAGLTYEQQQRRLQPRPGYWRRLLSRSE